jgi:hypothetical protein
MAKRVVKWALDGNAMWILKLGKQPIDDKTPFVPEAEFDLAVIYPNIAEMSDVQKNLIVYGTKQKLMDVGAGEKADADAKIKNAKDKWAELADGKWTGERTNATGAAENKRIVAGVKEASKVVSLEGLILKKNLFPATFTEEDENKLQEFLREAARLANKKNK